MSSSLKISIATAALMACGATLALAQTTPAPAAKSETQKSQANDGQSGGVATTPKGSAGPATDPTSKSTMDKSKMDDPRSGAVPDKSGAATGTGAGAAPTPGKGPNPTGVTSEKQKSEANDPGEGGKKQ